MHVSSKWEPIRVDKNTTFKGRPVSKATTKYNNVDKILWVLKTVLNPKSWHTPEYDKLPNYNNSEDGKSHQKNMTYAAVGSRNITGAEALRLNKLTNWISSINVKIEGSDKTYRYSMQTGEAKGSDSAYAGTDVLVHTETGEVLQEEFIKNHFNEWEKVIVDQKGYSVDHKLIGRLKVSPVGNSDIITVRKSNVTPSDKDLRTEAIAKELHPKRDELSGYALRAHARNTYQLFGISLNTPVDFVLAFNKEHTGGTEHSITLARGKGIPIIDASADNVKELVEAVMKEDFSLDENGFVKLNNKSQTKEQSANNTEEDNTSSNSEDVGTSDTQNATKVEKSSTNSNNSSNNYTEETFLERMKVTSNIIDKFLKGCSK